MTPQRRGLLATFIAIGLLLAVVVSIVLATSMTVSPATAFRDDGNNNQHPISLTGDLLDGSNTATWGSGPSAYWDLPNTSSPDPSYEMTYDATPTIDSTGVFDIETEVPLYDESVTPVGPGTHHITVCAVTTGTTGFPICLTRQFVVKKGTAVLSQTSGRPGDSVTITGKGWVPGNADLAVQAMWDPAGSNEDLDGSTFFYPSSSSWTFTFVVPSVVPGTYKILICNLPDGSTDCPKVAADTDSVTRQFTVVAPQVILNRNSGLAGQPFTYQGQNFAPSTAVKIYFGPQGATVPGGTGVHEITPGGGATTNSDGSFGKFVYSPSDPPGDYTVTACTLTRTICSASNMAEAPYSITAPTPSPSPTPKPTATPSPSPTPSPTPKPTATATATATPTPTAKPSPTVSPTPTASPSPTPTASPSPTPSMAPTASATDDGTVPPTTAPTLAPTTAPTSAPTPSPKPSPTAAAVVSWPDHLHSPGDTGSPGLDLTALGGLSLLALLIAFLVPFPGTLFNKTVEENYDEIKGWIAGLRSRWNSLLDRTMVGPLGAVRRGVSRAAAGRYGVWLFLGLSALIYGFLSPTFGLDSMSLALFLGLLVGLAFIVAAFDLPLRIYHGRTSRAHDRGVLRALWWTLIIAVICVVVSRLANFQPGYLYGLVVSIVFVTEISKRDEGIGTWLASVWLLGLSFVAWVALALVRQGTFDPWLALFLETVLVTFVVAGIETLAVGLLPMRFLPGHPLYQWRRGLWFVVFALSVMGYLLILVDPANGYLSDDSRTPMLVGIIFLVVFGVVSFGTWAYFRYRPAKTGGDRPGEAPAA